MRKLSTAVFTVAALTAALSPATAAEITIRVSGAGLDFTDEADVAVMKDRIEVAVAKACDSRAFATTYGTRAVNDCVEDGKAKALAALDSKLAPAD